MGEKPRVFLCHDGFREHRPRNGGRRKERKTRGWGEGMVISGEDSGRRGLGKQGMRETERCQALRDHQQAGATDEQFRL